MVGSEIVLVFYTFCSIEGPGREFFFLSIWVFSGLCICVPQPVVKQSNGEVFELPKNQYQPTMTTTSLVIITLALSWCWSSVGVQWANPTPNDGPNTLSAIQYHAQDNTLYLVGNTANTCWYGSIMVGRDSMKTMARVDSSPRNGVCHNVVVSSSSESDDDDGTDGSTLVWITGNAGTSGGILSEMIKPSTTDKSKNPDDYGFILNVAWDGGSLSQHQSTENNDTTRTRYFRYLVQNENWTDEANVTEMIANERNETDIPGGFYATESVHAAVLGGILMPNVVTTGILESQHHIYTLFLLQEQQQDKTEVSSLPSGSGIMVIHAWNKIRYNTSRDDINNGVQTLGENRWAQHIATEEDDTRIENTAGILSMGDVLLVGGSTRGTGEGLGISSGGTVNMDGFITKLFRHDGNLYGNTNTIETADKVSSLRIQTQTNKTNYVYNICSGGDDSDYVYVTGWTNGNVPMANGTLYSGGDNVKAFLMRIQVSTMGLAGAYQIGTVNGQAIRGFACVGVNDEYVYMAGNVENSGVVQGVETSGGGTDVFLAKMNASLNENIEWVRQIGGTSDDMLALDGGLAVTSDGNIIIAGNTKGSLYRTKPADDEPSDTTELFVAMVTSHGHVPVTVVSEDNGTSVPTTISPSVSPITQSPSLPPVETNKPTSPPTVPQQVFNFRNITIRLIGGPKLTKGSQQVFEATTVEFYHYVYPEKRRRRLQGEFPVSSFESVVKFHDQSHDKVGNTITYHHEISLVSTRQLSEKQARGFLKAPFENEQHNQIYIELLKEGDDIFKDVTSVNAPVLSSDEDSYFEPISSSDDGGALNAMIFIYIGLGILVCGIASAYYFTRREDKETLLGDRDDDDYDPETYMYERPEQPLGVDPDKMFDEASDFSFGFGDTATFEVSGGENYGMSMIGDDLFIDEGDNPYRSKEKIAEMETPITPPTSMNRTDELVLPADNDKTTCDFVAPNHTVDRDDKSGSIESDKSGCDDDDQSGSGCDDDDQSGSGSDDDAYHSDDENSSEGDRFV